MSRSRFFLSIGSAILLFSCASSTNTPNRINRSKTSATIVVGNDGKVDQPTVEICSRNGMTVKNVAVPSQILWLAEDTTATLTVDFPDRNQNCIRALRCSGNMCVALTNANIRGGNTQCEYHVSLNGNVTDPIVIVDDCCPPNP